MRCYKCEYYISNCYSSYEVGDCSLFLDFEACPTQKDHFGCKYNKRTLDKLNKKQSEETRKELLAMGIDIDKI